MQNLKLLADIVSPVGIMVALLTAGIVLHFTRNHFRLGHRLLISGAVLYLVFLFSPLSEVLILSLERPFPPMLVPPASPKIDRIVVLSGYGEENPAVPVTSNVTEETVYSMVEGVRLYRLLPGAKLVFSGGVLRKGDKSVAGIMADFVYQLGVPRQDIVLEANSLNTYENMVEVKKLVGSSSFILVTGASHMRRAAGIARKLQMHPYPAPARIRTSQNYPFGTRAADYVGTFIRHFSHPSYERFSALQRAHYEYLGYFWYWVLGRV
jgi:uncharacterized SAM-binding protein YcdF (DUF218 family)